MKSPAFSLYVRDALCSQTISKLHSKSISKGGINLCSRGLNAYWFLLLNAWLQIPRATLPNDDNELADLAKVSIEEWLAIKPILIHQFPILASGRLYNERLMIESDKQDKRQSAGSKGGSKRQANRIAAEVAALEDEDAIENESETVDLIELPAGVPKTEQEAIELGAMAGADAETCKVAWNLAASRGWMDGKGKPIRSWPHYLKAHSLMNGERKNERKQQNAGGNPAGNPRRTASEERNSFVAGAGDGSHEEICFKRGLLPTDHPMYEAIAKRVAEKMGGPRSHPS